MFTAEEAAQLVARYVGYTWPENKTELYSLLTLANDRIWQEGTWWGMNKVFNVKARKGPDGEHYITCPPGYDNLRAVNIDGKPKIIRDTWFQFHSNAYGEIEKNCGNWTKEVVDLGEHPTINDIYTCEDRPGKILIGACLNGAETSTTPPKIIRIEGEWDRGGRVWTYERETWSNRKVEALNEEEDYNPIFGAKIALNEKIRFIENIWWKRIDAITKDVTVNPVEVYAIHSDQTLQLLTTIEPHQKRSRHRRYMVPDGSCKTSSSCDDGTRAVCPVTVQGIFKVSKPEAIVYPTQPIYSENREALISLAIAMNEMYDKKEPKTAIPFLLNGVKALEDDNRENQTDDVFPVQVVGPLVDDVPEIVRFISH